MRKKIIASILFLIVFITSTIVYAAIDAKVQINSSITDIKPGEEVTFTVKVKDIVSENGANGIEGTISYDTDKFEELKAENVTKAGSWDVAYYNGKVIAEGLTAIKNDSDVISIKLKVKEDSSLVGQTASVSLNNTVVYNTDKVDLGTVSASVRIVGEPTPTPTVKPDDKDEPTPTPTATAKPDDGNENKPTPTPTATDKPDGGSESTPTPSTKPGGTNTTPTPTTSATPNNGVDKGDVPITNINTNTSSGSSTNNKGNTSNAGTTSSNSLPKAGIGSTIAILTVVAAIIGTVAYIKLRKYREI